MNERTKRTLESLKQLNTWYRCLEEGYLFDLHPDPGPCTGVEDYQQVSSNTGEYSHLQLVQQSNKETYEARKQINFYNSKF